MLDSAVAGPRSLCSAGLPTLPLHRAASQRSTRTHEQPALSLRQASRSQHANSRARAQPVADLALINVDYISPSLWLGLAVAVSGLVLYSFKLQNARGTKDLDIVTASLLVLCGGILTVQGWRLDPILMLSEGVLACVGVYYIIQTVELRKQLMDEYDNDPRASDSDFSDYYDDERVPGELPSTSSAYYDSERFYYPDEAPRQDRTRSWQEPYPSQWSEQAYWDSQSSRGDGGRPPFGADRSDAATGGRGDARDAFWDDDDLPPRPARRSDRGSIPVADTRPSSPSYGVQQDVPDSSVPSDEWMQRKAPAQGDTSGSRRDEVSW